MYWHYGWSYHPMHGLGWFLAIAAALYFLPTLVAWMRDAARLGAIFVVNLLFGWTMLVWLLCLVWALFAETRAQWAWRTFGPPPGYPPPGYPPGPPGWDGRG